MRHISIKLNTPCEFIDVVPINPLISKCQIKVCQVGESPNRNGSIITKEVARELANSLPGSPIVGRYLPEKNDFEEHSRDMVIEDGELVFKDLTQPYGFVDLGAKVWFQKFSDDGVEHEYLMTEGYIWTGRYPETQRIIEKGNNQSMELDPNSVNGVWSKDDNDYYEFFIINEAVISALCILGEDVEPCFEGASIGKVQFSLEDDFKTKLFSMMNEIKEILSKGGEPVNENEVIEENIQEVSKEETVVEEIEVSDAVVEAIAENIGEATEEFTVVEEDDKKEEICPECGKPLDECECGEEEEKKYSLEEIPEYVELSEKFSALQAQNEELQNELNSLREFKLQVERTEKQAMIDKFYMLSDEDKSDVITNIDSYSLGDIEAKLCVICFRKGVSFGAEEEKKESEVTTYNLDYDNATPAWIKAVEQRSK